jgi:hypothetical protein
MDTSNFLMTTFYNLIGFTAVPLTFIAFQMKSLRYTFALNALAAFFMAIHLLLIGATSGGIVTIAACLIIVGQLLAPQSWTFTSRLMITVPGVIIAAYFREPGWLPVLIVTAFIVGRFAEAAFHPLWSRMGMMLSYII